MITDAYGLVVERRSFDPWGKKRAVRWDEQDDVPHRLITNRGFTGHEHIEEVGLIHMNGRIYDQELGRFMSADPIIQAPFLTNSFNRYAYVMNNPLKYTDPTGFTADEGNAVTRTLSRVWRAIKNFFSGGSNSSRDGNRNRSNDGAGGGDGGTNASGTGEAASSNDSVYQEHMGDFYEDGTFEGGEAEEPNIFKRAGDLLLQGAKVLAVDVTALAIGQVGMVWTLGDNLLDVGESLLSGDFKTALFGDDSIEGLVGALTSGEKMEIRSL